MSQFFVPSVRFPVALVWILLVFLTYRYAPARWVFAALAGMTVGVYVGVFVGGSLELWLNPPHGSVPVAFQGMFLGGIAGALVGLAIGLLCARNPTAYWVLQGMTAAIVALIPLK